MLCPGVATMQASFEIHRAWTGSRGRRFRTSRVSVPTLPGRCPTPTLRVAKTRWRVRTRRERVATHRVRVRTLGCKDQDP